MSRRWRDARDICPHGIDNHRAAAAQPRTAATHTIKQLITNGNQHTNTQKIPCTWHIQTNGKQNTGLEELGGAPVASCVRRRPLSAHRLCVVDHSVCVCVCVCVPKAMNICRAFRASQRPPTPSGRARPPARPSHCMCAAYSDSARSPFRYASTANRPSAI